MPINNNGYFTGRTPISVGPNKDPGVDLEAFLAGSTVSVVEGEISSAFLADVLSPWVNVKAAGIDAEGDGTTDDGPAINIPPRSSRRG